MFKVGDRVKVARDNDNDCYNSFREKVLIITFISHSTDDHPGYDEWIDEPLYDFETGDGERINCSLYEYEIELA